jgi:hypothetical protein
MVRGHRYGIRSRHLEDIPLVDAFMSWRRDRTDVAKVESSPIFDNKKPLTDSFREWKEMKSLIRPGDELWTFDSPQQEWDRHMGWQGLLLIRDGELVEVVVTAQN